jgi:hypothetical protein
MRKYEVLLTASAEQSYLAIPDSKIEAVDRLLDVLAIAPDLGAEYDPTYSAARPPFAVRVLYAKPYGVYYSTDPAAGKVYVRHIEDERMNPLTRFKGRLGQE